MFHTELTYSELAPQIVSCNQYTLPFVEEQ
jgi:hypothetical protein